MSSVLSKPLILLKAGLFIFIGLVSCGLILVESPRWQTAGLLLAAIWAFCRAYYFAFYVIEKYLDPSFRFAGLGSAMRHLLRGRGRSPGDSPRDKKE
ncbi:hypothetical protein BH09VER1_BH09VER1_39970 [soil metagenome]